MRILSVKFVSLALVVSGLPVTARAQATLPPLRSEPLPVERLFPLVGEQCGCFTFRKGSALTDEAVVFSSTDLSGRIRIAKREHELAHTSRRLVNKTYINAFSANGMTVSITATEVPFEQACSTYPDPPPHGSCFVGSMDLRAGDSASTNPVIQLCGC